VDDRSAGDVPVVLVLPRHAFGGEPSLLFEDGG